MHPIKGLQHHYAAKRQNHETFRQGKKILKTGDEAITILYIPPYSGKSKTPKIVVSLEKFEKYQLTVSITSYQEIE
ncbi:MAG: hypothetical protein IPN68_18650 [Bacteroidetes bacterium]|nr:hypothetical protein [Bacteroidota bacterium]